MEESTGKSLSTLAAKRLRGRLRTLAELDGLEKDGFPLGWRRVTRTKADEKRLRRVLDATHAYDTLLLLGIGGSDLGARAVLQALPPKKRVLFAGANTDPDELEALYSMVDWKNTCVNIVSKSGDTLEPMSAFLVARERLKKAVGKGYASRIVATTDASHGTLVRWAEAEGFLRLVVPSDVGGRFSVFSDVGLFPAAWSGVDTRGLLRGAAMAMRADWPVRWAALHAEAYLQENRSVWVCMPYAAHLASVAFWFAQLIGESLGKTTEVGPSPLPALGATDQHSLVQLFMQGPMDKILTFLEVDRFSSCLVVPRAPSVADALAPLAGIPFEELIHAERRATADALWAAGRPSVTLHLPRLDAMAVGELLQGFMVATAYLGQWLEVNAYDQPGVEDGKRRFKAWLAARAG